MTSRAPLRLVACSHAVDLAQGVADQLTHPITPSRDVWFACGEAKHVVEANVRGTDVYLFQRVVVPGDPHSLYDRFAMLLHACDAARLADAERVTAVLPYFPGGRQDKRKGQLREGVSTGLIARLLAAAGASMVVTVEPHNEAMIGCFDPRVTVFEPVKIAAELCRFLTESGLVCDLVASTDVGGLETARAYAKRLGRQLVAVSKERDYHHAHTVKEATVIGDPSGSSVLVVDDIVDTAGSLTAAVEALWEAGATDVVVAGAHMLLSDPAWDRLRALEAKARAKGVRFVAVGSSSVLHPQPPSWYHVFPIEPLLAKVIRRVNERGSVRALENGEP